MSSMFVFIWILLLFIWTASTANDLERLEKLLKNDRLQFEDMKTSYIPIAELWDEIWPNAQLSMDEKYDSMSKYPPKMGFNHLIGSIHDDIEVILSENDIELTDQLIDGFESELKYTLNDIAMDRYWQFIKEMSGKDLVDPDKYKKRKTKYPPFNINGATSDYRYLSTSTPSTGQNGEYWSVSEECIKHKGCNVYPIFRIIHKTKPYSIDNKHLSFSCKDILTILLPQIYECVDQHGVRNCPLIIGHGHFRWVFKAKIPDHDEFVVIKMMKQTLKESPRDLLRHLRESIFLYYLRNQELEFMDKYYSDNTSFPFFVSNFNEIRAFPFVYELGHCIYPSYISVSHFYNMTLETYIDDGYAEKATISQLIKISLNIAKGIELLHNIYGGPYHHTDIRDDQFMIDNLGNILINDFNRGKFQQYLFTQYDYKKYAQKTSVSHKIIKCTFCPHSSNGNIRAPEEQINKNLDESIDIYSAALIIYSLFSKNRPFHLSQNEEDIEYLISATDRRPNMPSNMPFALQNVIRSALSQNPKNRPNAREFRKQIENIYKNLSKYTRKNQHVTSHYAQKHKLFHNVHYPKVSKQFPEFKGKSGDT